MNSSPSEQVLLVDDDPSLLEGLQRIHRRHLDLTTACGPEEGLRAIRDKGPYAVIVSDYQMPEMNGAELLEKVREIAPDTIRVLLTGNADQDAAVDAINRGHIFQFISKPCPNDVFRSCIESAIALHALKHAERLLLENTLRGCVEVLSEALALTNPEAFGRSSRVSEYARQFIQFIAHPDPWEIQTAALLSQLGLISIPGDIIERIASGEDVPEEHTRALDGHPSVARDLLTRIPRMERVAEIIAHQRTPYSDAKGAGLAPEVLLGSQVVAISLAFDETISLGAHKRQAIECLLSEGDKYAPKLLELLPKISVPGQQAVDMQLPVNELRVGMVLAEDVTSTAGALIIGKGNRITAGLLARLRTYSKLNGLNEPIRVRVDRKAGIASRVA